MKTGTGGVGNKLGGHKANQEVTDTIQSWQNRTSISAMAVGMGRNGHVQEDMEVE